VDAVGHRAARGEHEDRRVALGADAAADLVAVQLGQHEVEDDEVGLLGLEGGQRRAAIVGGHDPVPVALEVGAHELHDLAIVVHDEDGAGGAGHEAHASRGV